MASQRKRPASPCSTQASQSATSAGVGQNLTKSRKGAGASRRQSSEASTSQLDSLFFAEADGEKFVELTSLAKRVQKKQGDRALVAVWRRLGHDVLIPAIDGVRGVPFPTQRGHAREKLMPAANLRGFETYVGELNEDDVEANAALLQAVARELLPAGAGGGATAPPPFQLASRHKVMKLGPDDTSRVHVVEVKGRPLMVLTTLLETFKISNPHEWITESLLPFLRACGVPGCNTLVDNRRADEPHLASGLDKSRSLAKYLANGVEDYERALAARSAGLVRGRSAWNDGRETWLIDFPLLVLVINRLRTPQARRFQLASLEQSLVLMSGRQDVASRLAKYWREESMAQPDNVLLQFVGAAVDHEVPLRSEDDASEVQRGGGAVEARVVRACQDFFSGAVPKLVDALAAKFQDVLTAQARAQQDALAALQAAASQLSSVRPVVNINSSPRGGLDALEHANLDAPEDDGAAARIRGTVVPLSRFLRSCWRPDWTRAGLRHTAVSMQFAILMQDSERVHAHVCSHTCCIATA